MNADTCVSTEPQPSPEAPPAIAAGKRDRHVDLARIPWDIPWAMLDEYEAAAVLHQTVKTLRRQRHEGVGPRFRKLNGVSVRYRMSDLREYLEKQPSGGGGVLAARRGPGRPRKVLA